MQRAWKALGAGLGLAASACGVPPRRPEPQPVAVHAPAPGPYRWQPTTRSPQRENPPSGDFAAACQRGDAALARVAARVAERELAGAPLDADELRFALRSEGSPYVWPHAWTLSGPDATRGAEARLPSWLATIHEGGERRCALVRVRGERELVAVVAVSALADLDPLPTAVRVGTWVSVTARLLVAGSDAEVLVLGPRGAPHTVPASLDGGVVRARFSADRAGPWLVQLLARVDGGPRPLAEAMLFAGEEPPTHFSQTPAPGEVAAPGGLPDEQLLGMVNAARESEDLAAVVRLPALDALARAHATAMRDRQNLSHDVGDGSPADRAERAGLVARAVGENVAHAPDAARAHRMLWASPSHRANLLEPSFDAIGIGAARDDDETLWVCELFADVRASRGAEARAPAIP